MGYLLGYPRLIIDRLDTSRPGGRFTVCPDRHYKQRWPLLPLANWKAGKVPICVVDKHGKVSIEGETDPIVVLDPPKEETI